MAATVPRTTVWKSTYALVVISPAITTRPVAVRVSQATRLVGSSVRQASRMASEIWSAILSGWPSVTDSEVNKYRFFDAKLYVSLVHGGCRTLDSTSWESGNPRGRYGATPSRRSPIKAYQRGMPGATILTVNAGESI